MAFSSKTIHNPKTGQTIRFVRASRDTNGQLLEMESTFRAQSTKPAAHFHPYQVEDFTVIVGELTVQMGGQIKTLRAGDTLHVPRNTVHSMWNESAMATVVNWQVSPALHTEYFFETAFGLASDGKTDPKGMPPFLQTVLLAKHFSAVFRLAKPSPIVQRFVFGLLSPLAKVAGYRAVYRRYLD